MMDNIGVIGLGGKNKSSLGMIRQMAELVAASPYMKMPMEKTPKPEKYISIMSCSKCRASGTLKKVGKDEYKCLKCIREGK